MYVLTQDEKAIFDFNMYGFISANEDGEIYMGGATDMGFLLGKYSSLERAKDIVADMFASLDMSRYVMPVI